MAKLILALALFTAATAWQLARLNFDINPWENYSCAALYLLSIASVVLL